MQGKDIEINEFITVRNPTLQEIVDFGEERYWSVVNRITAIPFEYKVALQDTINVLYTEISDFEFFYSMGSAMPLEESKIVLGDNVDLSKLEVGQNNQNGNMVYFYTLEDGRQVVIDEAIYKTMTEAVCKINSIQKEAQVGANDHATQYLIDVERRKLKRHAKRHQAFNSVLLPAVSALVNTAGFKYDYDTVWHLSIYTFLDALKRMYKIKNYEQTMTGVYSGCIKSSDIDFDKINWAGKL